MSSAFRTRIKGVVNDPREDQEFEGQIALTSSGDLLGPPREFENVSAADTWASQVNEGLEFAAGRVLASFYLYRQADGHYGLSMYRPEVKDGEWRTSFLFLGNHDDVVWEVLNYKLKREDIPPGSCVDLTTGETWTLDQPVTKPLERTLSIHYTVTWGDGTQILRVKPGQAIAGRAQVNTLEEARELKAEVLADVEVRSLMADKRVRIVRTTTTEVE